VQRPDGGWQFEIRGSPIQAPSLEAIEQFPWPDPLDPARYDGIADQVRHLYDTTDYALCGRLGDNIWEQANYSVGQANWLTYVATDADFCVAIMRRIAEIQKTIYLEACITLAVPLAHPAGWGGFWHATRTLDLAQNVPHDGQADSEGRLYGGEGTAGGPGQL
jgi:hypothetical protein